MSNDLILPMFAHIILCVSLYALLTLARAPKVWGIGLRDDGANPWGETEPRISANLKNQFEWPLFFYIACLLQITTGETAGALQTALAWIFVAGRVIHSVVQIGTNNIRLRGIVFTINFIAVLAMWAELAYRAL
ncbi:MAPEG family protein [Pseudoteredinibacter isoporae]|uniref:MAPEG family protein n=1 Tax=Pseudoteredinibacter isoporae TaxID=570281 RepID=A0A7X0JVI7_9GAMM|nr:MAPEG family protein [Pseudoteredinibacter isoporae]MBB6522191.1 hypothetical protein [Pseudoteredinibacter isoporae]NHO87725.1 hypothetical protein [Pseudoteredinibacter isoporae]NIB23944.1 hypothetical protein [Pseudoteredinibacter isoporae]